MALTLRFSALVGMLALLAPACASAPETNVSAGGSTGSSTSTTSVGGGGAGGTGGAAPIEPACALDGDVTTVPWGQTVGPDDAVITAIAATSQAVFAGTGGGLFRSSDGGATWSRVDSLPSDTITAITVAGSDVFVATQKELFLGESHGASWKPIPDGIPKNQFLGLQVAYLSASGGDVFAIAEFLPYRWDAAAQHWNALPVAMYDLFDAIESDGTSIYANSMPGVGVFRFTGAGCDLAPELPQWGYHAFSFRGALGFAGNDTELSRTTDGGATWAPVSGVTGPILDLLTTPTAVFAATLTGVFTSTDDGASWTSLPLPETDTSPSLMSLTSNGADVFWGGARVRRSSDQGTSWAEAAPLRASTVEGLTSGDGVLYASTDEGRGYRSADGGASWSRLSSLDVFLAMTPFALAADGPTAFATRGFQGLSRSPDHGLTWSILAVHPRLTGEPVSRVFVVDGILFASSDPWEGGSPSPGSQAPTHLASAGLYRSANKGLTWKDANAGLPVVQVYNGEDRFDTIESLREAGGALFLSTALHGLWRSTDKGLSWASSNQGLVVLPTGHAPRMRGVVSLESHLLTAGDTAVARSTDGGSTWTLLEPTGLPAELAIRDIAAYKGHAFVSVGGPSGGVFWSSDGGDTWKRAGSGLLGTTTPLRLDGETLFAGLDGRAVWALPLPACTGAD